MLGTLLLAAGGALAQGPYVPTPGTNDLGISENDVRDEPNHNEDENGILPHTPYFSPQSPTLILEGTTEARIGSPFVLFTYDEDVSNIRNVLVHGDNYDDYSHSIYPGQVVYNAYWGNWTDLGGGGDLQQSSVTDGEAFVGDSNGAIDDAAKCQNRDWDEFEWRVTFSAVPEGNDCDHVETSDSMYAFIQPGTHNRQFNTAGTPIQTALNNRSDGAMEPDFPFVNVVTEQGNVVWRANSGFSRYEYDASMLISTQVVTSVNPKEVALPDAGPEFDPYTGATGSVHAHDVDVYVTPHPALEDAYRATIWDPPQDYGDGEDEENVFPLKDEGLKSFAKHEGEEFIFSGPTIAGDTISDFQEPLEPIQGTADDLVFGPYQHEPNTPEDSYPADASSQSEEWASHDPETSYGGPGDYYEPGDDQVYPGYQDKELYWIDAKGGIDDLPLWVPACCYDIGPGSNVRPEVPSTDDPVGSTAQEDDDNTVGPGIFKVWARSGTWHDANGDTWIGNASEGPSGIFTGLKGYETFTGLPGGQGDDGYDNGTDDDPNDYGSAEFRPVCNADQLVSKVVPTAEVTGPPADDDGDGIPEKDWGHAGVYVLADNGANAASVYTSALMDAAGPEGNTATEPLRQNDNVGPTLNGTAPADEDGRFSRYRMEGPIELGTWDSAFCESTGSKGRGSWTATKVMLFPGGSIDFPFKTVNTWRLSTSGFEADQGSNEDALLTGQTVTDVDHYDPMVDE